MATVTREWFVTYGAVTIGGSGDYQLHGDVAMERDHEQLRVEFSAIVSEANEAAFNTSVSALEVAFKKRRQTLITNIRASSETFAQATNTGFNAEPSIQLVSGSKFNTELSREYRCSVTLGLPSDDAEDEDGETGLLVAFIGVSELGTEQRVVSMRGTYTALGGDSARAQYEEEIEDYSTTVLTAVDATLDKDDDWDFTEKPNEIDWKNKLCKWSRVYTERIFDETNSSPNDPGLRNVSQNAIPLIVTPLGAASIRSGRRPQEVFVRYSCDVVRSVYATLREAWIEAVRPRVKKLAEVAAGGGAAQFVDYRPNFDYTSHKIEIEANLTVFGNNVLLFARVEEKISKNPGYVLIPAHGPNPHSKVAIPAPAEAILIRRTNVFVRGTKSTAESIIRQGFPESFDMYREASIPDPNAPSIAAPSGSFDLTDLPGMGIEGGGWCYFREIPEFAEDIVEGESETGDVQVILCLFGLTQIYIYASPAPDFSLTASAEGVGGGGGGAIES